MSGALATTGWNRMWRRNREKGGTGRRCSYAQRRETEPGEIEAAISSPADGATLSGPHTGVNVTIQGSVWSNRTIGGVTSGSAPVPFQTATLSGGNWTFTTTSPRRVGHHNSQSRTSTGIINDHTISINVPRRRRPTPRLPLSPSPPPLTGRPYRPNSVWPSQSLAHRPIRRNPDSSMSVSMAGPLCCRRKRSGRLVHVEQGRDAGCRQPHHHGAVERTWRETFRSNRSAVSVATPPPPDTAGPQVSITSPTTGSPIQGRYSGATVAVTGTCVGPERSPRFVRTEARSEPCAG